VDRSGGAIRSDVKRNFFAHSGLLEDYVEGAMGKKLAYKSECVDEVKEWLEKSEN
jgi:CRISPR/Cas system-associated protein Csx1